MPLELIFSASIWRLSGVDYLSGLLKNGSTRKLYALLAPHTPGDLRRLHTLATLNHKRHEAISRWMAISFITLPASAALMLSQLSPETLKTIADTRGLTRWYLVIAYIGAIVGTYLLAAWRARQLLTVIELALVERGVALQPAGDEPAEDPVQSPMGA